MRIGIAGSGLMGRVLAYQLVLAQHEVTLFDKDDEQGHHSAAFAAAGMLSLSAELEIAEPLIAILGKISINFWRTFLPKLDESLYFKETGSLMICHPGDEAELANFKAVVLPRLTESNTVQELDRAGLLALEPELTKFSTGFYFKEEAQLDNQAVLIALGAWLKQHVNWYTGTEVMALTPGCVQLSTQKYHFDWVIDCRGMGAQSSFPELRAVRGELLWLKAQEVQLTRMVRLLHPRYRLYIVPRPEHVYLVGATEIEALDMSPISVRSQLELLTAAVSIHSGFMEARIIKTVTQCRPTLPDGMPKIKRQEGLIAVNGLYRHGFLLAPALAELIAAQFDDSQRNRAYQITTQEISHKTKECIFSEMIE